MSLIVKNLTKSYSGKIVVDNLSFEMPKPGVYAILGTNGAGKTTSIRMILGMLERDSGEVLWNGEPLTLENCNVGFLAEERGLYPKCKLMDQLIYFANLRGVSKQDALQRIRYWSKRLELDEYLFPEQAQGEIANANMLSANVPKPLFSRTKRVKPRKADTLSKGNQQKIQFLISLLSDPELLVLDEPFGGLDPVNTDIFKGIVREEIERGKYLIMSAHQMEVIEEFCTDLTILNRSKVVLNGNLNEIKKSYGRVNLRIKCESDISEIIAKTEVKTVSVKEFEYNLKVSGEKEANSLLKLLIDSDVQVIAFELREPSLHEIFVEKVGEHE